MAPNGVGVLACQLEDGRAPRVTPRIERMAEAGNGLPSPERIGDEPGRILRRSCAGDEGCHERFGAPPWRGPRESRQSGGEAGPQICSSGGGDPGREGRGGQFVIGAEDQRRFERPRSLTASRDTEGGREGRRDGACSRQPSATESFGRRGQALDGSPRIVGLGAARRRRREGEHGAERREGGGQTRSELSSNLGPAGLRDIGAGPEPLADALEAGATLGQRHRRSPPVERSLGPDPADRGLEDRLAVGQRRRRRWAMSGASVAPLPKPRQVLARVQVSVAGRVGKAPHPAAARVGVQRRPLHAQEGGGFGGAQQLGWIAGSTWIVESRLWASRHGLHRSSDRGVRAADPKEVAKDVEWQRARPRA